MTKDDRADSSAPTPCSSADGSQIPHDASRSSVANARKYCDFCDGYGMKEMRDDKFGYPYYLDPCPKCSGTGYEPMLQPTVADDR